MADLIIVMRKGSIEQKGVVEDFHNSLILPAQAGFHRLVTNS